MQEKSFEGRVHAELQITDCFPSSQDIILT